MHKSWKVLSLAFGVAFLVGALAVGGAFAQDPTPAPTKGPDVFLGKVAKILGIEQQKLTDAFTQARVEMIDDAVVAGQITKERGDWMKQGIQQGFLGRGGPGGHIGGHIGGHMGGPMGHRFGGKVPAPTATPAPAQ